jgi:hypothetical protein
MMRQLAWLDFCRGKWQLITGNPKDPVRQWADRNAALSDLSGEGWNVRGPYPKKPDVNVKSWGSFQGYAVTRTLH